MWHNDDDYWWLRPRKHRTVTREEYERLLERVAELESASTELAYKSTVYDFAIYHITNGLANLLWLMQGWAGNGILPRPIQKPLLRFRKDITDFLTFLGDPPPPPGSNN